MDWWVDGHYIFAPTAADAKREAASLYDFEPNEVRPWTDADQKRLDEMFVAEHFIIVTVP